MIPASPRPAHRLELDPVWWTSSERRIRWPEWDQARRGRRVRRQFTEEFKAGAVRLVLDEERTVGAVARELDLTPSALAGWVRAGQAERTQGKSGLMKEDREELVRLRKELRIVQEEREILKKAAAGSIGQCNSGRSVSAGVAYPSVLRGRELRRCAMVLRSACV